MSVYALSDFHLSINSPKPMDIFGGAWEDYWSRIKEDWQKVLPEDTVLIAGDISWAMSLENAKADLMEIGKLAGSKIILRGNHDYWWNSLSKVRGVLPVNMYALQNDVVRIGNLLVCGTRGWSLPDKNSTAEDEKIFAREQERLKLSLAAMQKVRQDGDTVVGMLHYPPFNATFGATVFTDLFRDAGVNTVVYGHLHGKDVRAEKVVNVDGVKYYLTSCDLCDNKLVKLY